MKSDDAQHNYLTYFTAWFLNNVQQNENSGIDLITLNENKLSENKRQQTHYRNTNKP